jgi:hypothetical protein
MNRVLIGAVGGFACLGIAACGSAAAGGAPTPSPSSSAGGRSGFARNAAFGQLVQINGSTLILSGTTGDATVTYAATTSITQTSTGTLANITPGMCITATGTKDATGMLTATSVLLSAPVSGSCATAGLGGRGGGTFSPRPGATPRPSFSPPAGAPGFTAARGLVKSVTGTSVTLTATTGVATTINVPTTVKVTTSATIAPAALQTGECVTAIGPKNSAGTVAARSLTITAAGANGCTLGFGGGGFGGFGGGGGLGSASGA